MAMAAPAAKKAATSAASKAKNVTPKKKPPVVSKSTNRQTTSIATKQAHAGISVGAHQARSQASTAGYAQRQQSRVAASRQIAVDRQEIREAAEANQYAVNTRRKRKSAITGAATDVAKAPFKPRGAGLPSGPNPLMLILFTMGGVIILYAMITQPDPTSRFFTSMREWVKLIYTSDPIFSVKIKQEPTK